MSPRANPKALDEWASIIAAHGEALRDYQAAIEAAQSDPGRQGEADSAFHVLLELERTALRQPATSPTAFKFKLALWGDGRVEGYEQEWQVFSQDCERLLLTSTRR